MEVDEVNQSDDVTKAIVEGLHKSGVPIIQVKIQQDAKIGWLSRVDYGSEGFRRALVESGFNLLRLDGTHFNVLPGGLISKEDIDKKLKEKIKKVLEEDKAKKRKIPELEGLSQSKRLRLRKEQIEVKFLKNIARELANIIPRVTMPDPEDPEKKKNVDLFIMTSPAFDGDRGEKVAKFLAELRSDIWLWHQGGDRLFIKYVDKNVWALAPEKAVFMRGDYYSTAAERVIKDKIKQTSQKGSPYHFVVGCFGSSINKPKGELKYQYITVPALHRIERTKVNENQIGVRVTEYPADGSSFRTRTYNLKDLVANELTFIVPPADATENQKKIIEILKSRFWATPGILKYMMTLSAETISQEMQNLMGKESFQNKGRGWPGVVYSESSKKYHFNLDWIQRKLRYITPEGPWNEDRIISFACLHAGSRETDYEFFVNEVPKLILKFGVKQLVGAGDFIEGMRHNLDRRGEIVAGFNNYTLQEMLSARLVGTVIEKVYKAQFIESLEAARKTGFDTAQLHKMVEGALINFHYIPGNHDLWQTDDGYLPLKVFYDSLLDYLSGSLTVILIENNLPPIAVADILRNKIKMAEFFELPSGLKVSLQHPHMSRTKTTSIRPQEMLDFAKRYGCQVSIGGNFHTSEHIEEWDMDLGQCVSQQIGTIKHGSNFEKNKMKIVDQGVGYLRILSKDRSIFMSESAFYGESKHKEPVDNLAIINTFVSKLGLAPISL